MKHDKLVSIGQNEETCRYGSSRLRFRGPAKPLNGRHIAFVGGSETVPQSLTQPYPALLEEDLGEVCINFGQFNGSIDVAMHDPLIGNACRDAVLTVVAVTGAANMSNRFYSVYPRRNDRFIKPSSLLRGLFPHVDFTDICFTRHLLRRLHESAPDRFSAVREELQAAWSARMRTFLDRIGPNVVLTWFAPHTPPSDEALKNFDWALAHEPLFVTAKMIEQLRPLVLDIVLVPPAPPSNALEPLGLAAHRQAATALLDPIRSALDMTRRRKEAASVRAGSALPVRSSPAVQAVPSTDILAVPVQPAQASLHEPKGSDCPQSFGGHRHLEPDEEIGQPVSRNRSIAVLPFSAVVSSDESLAYADILTEDLTEALFKCPGLDVQAPPILSQRQPTPAERKRLVEEVGLSHVVGGSLRVIDGEIRFTAKLLDLERGYYLWIQHYDKPLQRSVRVLEKVSHDLAQVIAREMSSDSSSSGQGRRAPSTEGASTAGANA